MAVELPPGIGDSKQAMQATAFVREQPWYQQWLQANHKTVNAQGNPEPKLTDSERAGLMALSLKNGIGLNHKFDSIDENGQIAEEHHKLKKVAIAAAIAGLALTGFGAAGIGPLAGALGGAAGASGAASAAALEAGAIPGIASATALGLPVTAGLGTAGALGAAGAAAGAAGAASAAGGAAPLATTAIPGAAGVTGGSLSGAAGAGIVPATTSSLGAGGSAALLGGGGLTLSKVAGLAKNAGGGGDDSEWSDILGAAGSGIGGAANAAGNNRLTAGELALKAQQVGNQTANTNISGQNAFEGELMARAKEEQGERSDALKNIYRDSFARNRTPGPYNERGLTPYSPEYLAALADLTKQGGEKLKTKGTYDTSAMPELKPYVPVEGGNFDPKQFMDEYGNPSTMEKVGSWLSPTLSTLGKVAKYF